MNIIDFPGGYVPDIDGNPPTYYHYGDMMIVYLSSVAPDYKMPIQTVGFSTGGQPAIDVGIRLNLTYRDARYAVNHVTFQDATGYCRDYSENISVFLTSSVEGEQCWIDNYVGTLAGAHPDLQYISFHSGVLNVFFDKATSSLSLLYKHQLPANWYGNSLTGSDMNRFDNGVVAGTYWSVAGPGKNLQLASTPGIQTYKFTWYGDESSGYMDFYDEPNHPGRLPEPVTLVGPVDIGDPNGFVLTCEESENAVGYELLFGSDPYRVMDYNIISDTPAPPNDVITILPDSGIWWTVRVRDQYGSTIFADPEYISMVAYNPNPANGSTHPNTWANLTWTEGRRTASYDVYFGENFVNVRDGTAETFRSNQTSTYFIVGFPGFPYPNGLVPGTTYFWRIDDVGTDGTSIHIGNIWSFTVSP